MVRRVDTRLLARGYGALDRLFETSPLAVAQERLEIPRAPVFRAVLVDLPELLEGSTVWIGGDFVAQVVCSRFSYCLVVC